MNFADHLDHLHNAPTILAAIAQAQFGEVAGAGGNCLLRLPGLRRYQHFLLAKFAAVIRKPSFDYISKTPASWLLVGDRRREIASDITLIIERHGLGVGILVLHLQQIASRHILTQIGTEGHLRNLATPTACLRGEQGELVLSIPIRQFRSDLNRLADLNHACSLKTLVERDDVTVRRLRWPVPVYVIRAEEALNTGLVGNDLAGVWRLLGGSRKVPYKSFRDGYIPGERDKVHAHTQNLYVPGSMLGTAVVLVPRDRERVDYQPEDISLQVRQMIAAIAPESAKVSEFEASIRELFPP